MRPTVYTASKPRHAPLWRRLRDEGGLNVIATWINYAETEDAITDWVKLWVDCASEAACADVTLVYLEQGDELRGAYVEMGVALGCGKQVYFVNPDNAHVTDAIHHPLVTQFKTLEEAVAVLSVSRTLGDYYVRKEAA